MGKRSTTTGWADALARLRPRDRAAAVVLPVPPVRPVPPDSRPTPVPDPRPVPAPRPTLSPAQACGITGAKKVKKKCCRSTPRCKGCPVVLMRAARAAESGLTGKELARAVKRARAA